MDDSIRLAKESFVTGHEGGYIHDIHLVCLILALSCITSKLINHLNLGRFTHYVLDYAIIVIPCLFASLFTDYLICILAVQLWIILVIYVNQPRFSFQIPDTVQSDLPDTLYPVEHTSYIPAISRIRTGLLLLTGICILAVDFPVFPRANAKTELYGTGLMDVGVGAFLFCNALVLPMNRIRDRLAGLTHHQHNTNNIFTTIVDILKLTVFKTFRHILPTIGLGVLRWAGNSAANYQVHTTEYGIHWNFFITLSFVLLAISLIDALFTLFSIYFRQATTPSSTSTPISFYYFQCALSFIGGIALLIVYQILLDNPHFMLKQWVTDAPRVDIITANKEGIVSLCGYTALACFGIGIGTLMNIIQYQGIHCNNQSALLAASPAHMTMVSPKSTKYLSVYIARTMFIAGVLISVLFAGLTWWCVAHVDDISRRLCNASFVLWITTLCSALLTICMIPELLVVLTLRGGHGFSYHISKINQNQPNTDEKEKKRQEQLKYLSYYLESINAPPLSPFTVGGQRSPLRAIASPPMELKYLSYFSMVSGKLLLLEPLPTPFVHRQQQRQLEAAVQSRNTTHALNGDQGYEDNMIQRPPYSPYHSPIRNNQGGDALPGIEDDFDELMNSTQKQTSQEMTATDGLLMSQHEAPSLSTPAHKQTLYGPVHSLSRQFHNTTLSNTTSCTSEGVLIPLGGRRTLFVPTPAESPVLAIVNAVPLRFFLITNLLTGLTNLSIDTMHTPDLTAIMILIGYISLSIFTCSIQIQTQDIEATKQE